MIFGTTACWKKAGANKSSTLSFVGQNLFLQAEALGLGAGIVGAFNDREVVKVMDIPRQHEPLLIMPVGYKN
jgi:nitroreductase